MVIKARHRATGQFRCVKKINKTKFTKTQSESIMNEIKVLAELDHPNIVKIFEYYESENSLYLITELLTGGELFEKISENTSFSEKSAKIIIKQILSAVAYLHQKGFIHRDLKPENIVFEGNDEFTLKVIDFGTSRKIYPDSKLTTKMGTPYYIAPEVLQKSYDQKCDIWSIGVITYILLCGYPPFNGDTDDEI